jgi:cell division septation protein DedD
MSKKDKQKRIIQSFSPREFVLFIGGIAVICFLFYLFGYNMGKNRALDEFERTASLQTETAREKEATPPGSEERSVVTVKDASEVKPEAKPDSVQEKEREGEGLTFYQTLSDPEKGEAGGGPALKSGGSNAEAAKTARTEPKKGAEKKEAPARMKKAAVEKHTPAAAPSTPGIDARYSVQVSSYKSWPKAMDLKKRLLDSGYKVFVTQTKSANGTWFRVRVGIHKSKESAEQSARRIGLKENLPGFVVQLDDKEGR